MIYLATLVEETKDKVDGYMFVHSKQELDKIVCDNLKSHKVIIRPDFAKKYFTPTGLSSYIQNVRSININIVIELDMENKVITDSDIIKRINNCRSVEEVVELAMVHGKEYMDTIKHVVNDRKANNKHLLELSNQVSRLQSIIDIQQKKIENQEFTILQESRNKLAYQSQLHVLTSRINYQYNKNIDTSKLFTVNKNVYDKVLYIKEYSRVQYVDTFIFYLKEILKTLYGMPTRSLVIESYYAESKIDMYPNYTPHNRLIERDVISGDILMLGMQPDIMQSILKNPTHVSILIVLDRGGYSVPHIKGDNVEMIYTFSDLKDKPDFIPNGRCISYSKDTLNIPMIRNFEELDSSQRIGKYSSLELMKSIIKLLERK